MNEDMSMIVTLILELITYLGLWVSAFILESVCATILFGVLLLKCSYKD